MWLERICCAKCMAYTTKSSMRLIQMGRSKRLVCLACFEKRNQSWFKKEGKKDADTR